MKEDAIVNAAKPSLLGGSGVDGAIHGAAGPGLRKECETLGGCAIGSAKITDAYNLPCKKVIHAVGPRQDRHPDACKTIAERDRLLAGCYTTALNLAVEHGCRSIAFPSISTGVYRVPIEDASAVALETIRQFLEGPKGGEIDLVRIVVWPSKEDEAVYKRAFQ
jgi:O-acetyl-ADP-ribose deacetylase (regulator of RNase III)